MKEKDIENQILSVLKLYDLCFWKNNSVGIFDPQKKLFRRSKNRHAINGVSDILGCINGRMVAIEVKGPKGKASPDQLDFINKINASGGLAFIANSLDKVAEVLNKEFDLHLNV